VIALLDAGVLVALFDPAHVHHEPAHAWLEANRATGWATCPITELGFVRTVSDPDYPGSRSTVAAAVARLQAFTESGDHHFWPDSTSLRRASRIDVGRLGDHGSLTAAYLLLLAVHEGGRLVTFQHALGHELVPAARPYQLVRLP